MTAGFTYYFQKIVEKEKIPPESFFHPKNSKNKAPNCPRSINIAYVQNLCKSDEFVGKFMQYLSEELEAGYNKSIDSKLTSLIQHWETDFENSTNRQKTMEEIGVCIEKNTKCKLPWTMNEVKEAACAVRRFF